MQKIFFPKESSDNENRAPVIPEIVKKFTKLGVMVFVERSIGEKIAISDEEYQLAGANIVKEFSIGAAMADIVLRIKCSSCEEISKIKSGAIHISLLDKIQKGPELDAFKSFGVQAISLEMIPRTTIAQKFDVLSSQSNLAGYSAVLQAITNINKAVPMMTTPAGTINPVNVFVIGIGVAGLQAIATAKRLGARIEAFDTRPETEEQAKSLGAKFLRTDLGKTEKTEQGYAKELTDDQLQKQRSGMISSCKAADIVITTAKVFGRRAPLLVTKDMLDSIDSKTLFVDMAVAAGGNVDGSEPDKLIRYNNHISILGLTEAEQFVAMSASQMFAENMFNFVEHFFDRQTQLVNFSSTDDIVSKCLVV